MAEAVTSLIFDASGEVAGHKAGMEAAGKHAAALRKFKGESDGVGAGERKKSTALERAADAFREQGRVTQTALKITKEWNISMSTASQVSRRFKGHLEVLTPEIRAQAVALDRAQRETRELARAQAAASKTGGSHLVTVQNLHRAYAALAGVVGVGVLARGILHSVEAFENQERVAAQVEARLRSTGNAVGITSREIADFAGEWQRATGIADEETQQLAASLIPFTGIVRESFNRVLSSAFDMAEVLQTDVKSSLLVLAKAAEQPERAQSILRRSGISLSAAEAALAKQFAETGQAAKAQAVILDAVEKRYGGAAKAAREAGGSIAALKTEFGDFTEVVGAAVFEGGGKGLTEWAVDFIRSSRELIATRNAEAKSLDDIGKRAKTLAEFYATLARAAKAVNGEESYLTKQLGEQAAALFRASANAKKYQQEMLATIAVTQRYAATTDESAEKTSYLDKELNKLVKSFARGTQVRLAARTAQEVLNDELQEARELARDGAITTDTLRRAQEKYNEATQALQTAKFTEARDRLVELRDQLTALQAAGEVDIQIRLNTEDMEAVVENVKTTMSGTGMFGLPLFNFSPALKEAETLTDALIRDTKEIVDSYDGIKRTHEEWNELWAMSGRLALSIADSIGGEWGDMIGGLVDGVMGLRDAWKQVQAAQGGLAQASAAAGFGQQVGGLMQQFGIAQGRGGTSSFGGQMSGDYGDIGATVGAIAGSFIPGIGTAIGAIIGGLLGGAIKSGADEGLLQLRQAGDELQVTISKDEGGLGGVVGEIGESISAAVRSLEEIIGTELMVTAGEIVGGEGISGAGVALAIKIREETIAVFINGMRREFENIEDAVEFATVELAKSAAGSSGLSENVAAVLKNTMAETFDQLGADLERALTIDAALMTDQERFISERTRLLRQEFQATKDLGINMEDFFEVMIRGEEAMNRATEASALQAAGVDASVQSTLEFFKQARAQAEAQDAVNAAYQEMVSSLATVDVAAGSLGDALEEIAGELPDLEGGLKNVRDRLGDIGDRMEQTGESFQVAAREIEGIDVDLLNRAAEAFELMQVSGFLRQVAEATGDAQLLATAMELENQARRIQLQLSLEQLRAYGLLTAAIEAQVTAALAAWDAAVAAGRTPGAPIRGGAGGASRREQAKREAEEEARRAAEEQERMLDTLRTLTEEWTAAGHALRDTDLGAAVRDLAEKAQEDLAAAAEAAAADPAAYDRLRAQIEEGLQASMAAIGRAGLDALDSPLRSLAQSFRETRREILYMISHADELGLTLKQVGDVVRQAVLPGFLDSVLTIANANASTADGAALAAQAAARKTQIERALFELEFRNQILLLETAGAMTPALREMADNALALLDTTKNLKEEITDPDPDNPFAGWTVQAGKGSNRGGGADGGARPAAEESFEEFIRRLLGDTGTEMERLERKFRDIFAAIAASSRTAAEKAQALTAAEEELARLRQELTDRQLAGLFELAARLEAEIIARQTPKAQIEAAQAAFQTSAASLDINDEDSVQAFQRAAEDYLEAAQDYSGKVNSQEILYEAQRAVRAALSGFGIGTSTGIAAPAGVPAAFSAPGFAAAGILSTPGLPQAPPSPIVVSAPGQRIDLSGMQREIAGLRAEVAAFRKESAGFAGGWGPTKEAIGRVGNYITRSGL